MVESSSNWSGIQTIYMDGTTSSFPPSQTTTSPPITSEGNGQPQSPFSNPLFIFGAGILFAGIIVAMVTVILKRHLKTSTYISND